MSGQFQSYSLALIKLRKSVCIIHPLRRFAPRLFEPRR